MIIQAIKNSLILNKLAALWQAIAAAVADSAAAGLWRRFSAACKAGRIYALCARAGALTRAWPESRICAALNGLANCGSKFTGFICRKMGKHWDSSVMLSAVAQLGRHMHLCVAVLALAALAVPSLWWNNMFAVVVIALLVCVYWAAGGREKNLRMDVGRVSPWFIIFALMVCMGMAVSPSRAQSLPSFIYLFFYMVLVVLAVTVLSDENRLMQLINFIIVGVLIASLYGIAQLVLGLVEVNELYMDLSNSANEQARVFSFFGNPNSFGQVLVMLLPFTAVGIAANKSQLMKLISLLALVTGVVALLLTYSRASWGALVVSVLVYVFFTHRRAVPVIIIIGLLAIPFLPSSILDRFLTIFTSSDTSAASRVPVYTAGIKTAMENLVTGVGLGGTVAAGVVENSGYYTGSMSFMHVHNLFLQMLLETGVFGLIGFAGICFGLLKTGIQNSRSESFALSRISAAGAAGMSGVLVCGLVDHIWTYPRVMLIFWLLGAVIFASAGAAGRAKTE